MAQPRVLECKWIIILNLDKSRFKLPPMTCTINFLKYPYLCQCQRNAAIFFLVYLSCNQSMPHEVSLGINNSFATVCLHCVLARTDLITS